MTVTSVSGDPVAPTEAQCPVPGWLPPVSSGVQDLALTTPRTAHSHRTGAGICLEFVIRAADEVILSARIAR